MPSLLRHVPPASASRVLRCARRRQFCRNEVIFHEGDPADSIHMIVRGRVAVIVTGAHGQQLTFMIMGRDQFFGELSLLGAAGMRTATISAIEPTETLAITWRDFDALRLRHPAINDVLLRILADRVCRLSDQLHEALYLSIDTRVRRRLVELARIYDEGNGSPVIPLAQEELAHLAGTARATVNRILRQEEALGAVRLGRRRVIVLDVAALAQRADSLT